MIRKVRVFHQEFVTNRRKVSVSLKMKKHTIPEWGRPVTKQWSILRCKRKFKFQIQWRLYKSLHNQFERKGQELWLQEEKREEIDQFGFCVKSHMNSRVAFLIYCMEILIKLFVKYLYHYCFHTFREIILTYVGNRNWSNAHEMT